MAGYSGTPLSTKLGIKLGIKDHSLVQVLGELLPIDLPVHPTPGAVDELWRGLRVVWRKELR